MDAAGALVDDLRARKLWLAAAESLTGGAFAAAITAVPGAGDVFRGSFVTYVDEAKRDLLGVDGATLERVGAVSAEVARAMALGARDRLRADVAVSFTGFAGPDAPPGKRVGQVFLAVATSGGARVVERAYAGDREAIRAACVRDGIALAREAVSRSGTRT